MWRSWESQTPLTRSIAHTVPILVQHDIRCKNSFVEVCHILKTILFEKFHTTAGRKGKSSLCIVDPAWTRPVHSRESERDYWARGYLLISSKKLKLTAINFVFKLFSFQMVQYIFIQLRVSFMCGKLGLFVWWATCSRVPQLKCIWMPALPGATGLGNQTINMAQQLRWDLLLVSVFHSRWLKLNT